ncbi:hypothetical protein IQ249_22415, partial [Lusitaniella coriacea LEGE 07157]|nr:hypothetical protein [Lusitaniella coriacea LEGE 07157]
QKALEDYQGMIADHHAKYELNNYSNRKSGGRTIEDTINIAELIPDGLDL